MTNYINIKIITNYNILRLISGKIQSAGNFSFFLSTLFASVSAKFNSFYFLVSKQTFNFITMVNSQKMVLNKFPI